MDRLSAEQLKELLHYDPTTGAWTWKASVGRKIRPGDSAGCYTHKSGYGQIGIQGKLYLTHKVGDCNLTQPCPVSQP